MLPYLLAAWVGAASADLATTHAALGRGAREGWLPTQSPWAIDTAIGGATAVGLVGIPRLWRAGHHRQALLVTGLVVGVHTAAALHNSQVR